MSSSFFSCFSKVLIINLAERSDRRQEMSDELLRYGAGIDGRTVSIFEAIRPADKGAFPSIGARGCFFSHLGALEQARDDKVDTVLILEDDAHLGSVFGRRQEAVAAALRAVDWDIFYAGYRTSSQLHSSGDLTVAPPELLLETSHALAFSAAALDRVVPYLDAMRSRAPGDLAGGPMHVDGAYNWFRASHPGLQTVLAAPEIITQRASRSDITPQNTWLERVPFLNSVRRLKNHLN